MHNYYLYAFDETRNRISYYEDWVTAFRDRGYCALNLFDHGLAKVLRHAWRLDRADVIVIGYSSFYNFGGVLKRLLAQVVRRSRATKIVFMENEYRLFLEKTAFAEQFGAAFVTTQFPLSQVRAFYRPLTSATVLPLTHALNPAVFYPGSSHRDRDIDVGTRSVDYPWYFGDRDRWIANRFGEVIQSTRLRVDMSTDPNLRMCREDWAAFLRRTRCTVSSEAGSSCIEADDKTRKAVNSFLDQHPNTSFDQIYIEFFAGRKDMISGKSISSRHLEAMGTKTTMVLIEGQYNDVLTSGVHYIPLRRDLSNRNEVIERLQDLDDVERMAESAFVTAHQHTHSQRLDDLLSAVGRPGG